MDKPVIVVPSDNKGCGSYRMSWPAEACALANKPVLLRTKMPRIDVDSSGNLNSINIGNYKIVVIQRPVSYQISQMIDLLHDHGVRVVIDMDDSLSKLDPKNPVYTEWDPRRNHQRNWMNAAKACDKADLITCTTEVIAEEYGNHGRVKIIKNHVPKRYLEFSRPDNETPIVTWAGWTAMHPGDLMTVGHSLNQALEDTGAIFMAYGDLEIFKDLRVPHKSPHLYRGFQEINFYPKTLVQADIGIVPLKPSAFNEGKSWLKALEYASLGIVPVASPTPDNRLFAEMGGCIIAENRDDWYRELTDLILDHDKRAEMSKKVREVAAEWTIEDNYSKWWDAWQSAAVL